jgi:broad specificity phosphatase PhoE
VLVPRSHEENFTDANLTKYGIAQAQAVGQRLAGVHVDVVIVSPLRRTLDTAVIACKTMKTEGTSFIAHGE